MPGFRRLQAGFVFLLLWESACHRKQVSVPLATPPPPAPVQTGTPAPPTPEPPAANTPTPGAPTSTKPAQDSNASSYQVNKPPQAAPAARKPARSAASPQTASPTATTPAAQVPPSPPPKLGDVLSEDERKQYAASIDQSLARAQTSLSSIASRQLNADQQSQLGQIRNFMKQAQATRVSDPAGAKSLAERSEILARDLAASFR